MELGSGQQAAALGNACAKAASTLQVYTHSRPAWLGEAAPSDSKPASCHTVDSPALAMSNRSTLQTRHTFLATESRSSSLLPRKSGTLEDICTVHKPSAPHHM